LNEYRDVEKSASGYSAHQQGRMESTRRDQQVVDFNARGSIDYDVSLRRARRHFRGA
jgi:hypothetical protein